MHNEIFDEELTINSLIERITYYTKRVSCHNHISANKFTIVNVYTECINSKNHYICFDTLLSSSGGFNQRCTRSSQPPQSPFVRYLTTSDFEHVCLDFLLCDF